jgi:hypothetical protein
MNSKKDEGYIRSRSVANIRATDRLRKIYFLTGESSGNFENHVQILFQNLTVILDNDGTRPNLLRFKRYLAITWVIRMKLLIWSIVVKTFN